MTPTLILLPGLDGTEVFYQPLVAALRPSIRSSVIAYPPSVDAGSRYEDLLPIVQRAIVATSDCYLVGWSFGGPLALMAAAAEPEKVRGVVLAASFVRAPSEFLRRWRGLVNTPVIWTYRALRRLPLWLFRPPGDPWRRAKSTTWSRTSAAVVAARIRTALVVDVRRLLSDCPQPMCYVASSKDEIISRRNLRDMLAARPSMDVRTLDGRHLAMYAAPEAAAPAIADFIAACESGRGAVTKS